MNDDLATRLATAKTLEDLEKTRNARFGLYIDLKDTVVPNKRATVASRTKGTFLDELMSEIPG